MAIGRSEVRGNAGIIDPLVKRQLGFERLVALDQILADIGEENRRCHRLELVPLEPALEPRIEFLAADRSLDRAQEGGALFIGNVGQPVVGMAALEVDVQPRIGPSWPAILLDRLVHRVDAKRDLLRGDLRAIDGFDDAPFGIGGHALVEPEVGPGGVGGEVARPAMRQFVRDQADEALVAGDESRREERQGRIFHPPERERRRQDEHVVAAPGVGAVERLGGVDHLLGIGQLGGGLVEHRRLGPHAGALAQVAEGEVADADRDHV